MTGRNDYAVSPVVGVMLMLVVTIIIAAVVSAFAGGLGSSQAKAPQATIAASYSQSGGMTIYHNGGDTLSGGEFKILLTPAKNWDIVGDQYTSVIDQSLISNGNGTYWLLTGNVKSSGKRVVSRFAPGDVAFIDVNNCSTEKLLPNMVQGTSNYGINQSKYIGSSFFLKFVTTDGKQISITEVPIQP
ncbi:MAG TPA: type IV pilin N-terminal domain-containing protein [Methanoregula sp.]|nr:type IV pilin N-terminal domain-containing protein [Methanoregula sp.]